jgi:hypothetical protein
MLLCLTCANKFDQDARRVVSFYKRSKLVVVVVVVAWADGGCWLVGW